MSIILRILFPLLLALPFQAWAVSPMDKLAEDVTEPLDRGVPVRVIVQMDAGDETLPVNDPVRRSRIKEVREKVLSELPADGYDQSRAFSNLPMMGLRIKNRNALDKLLEQSDVVTVFPDKPHKALLAQSLPLISQPAVANVMERTGANVTVAVLDSGGLYTRPEFGNCTAIGTPASCKVVAAQDFTYEDDQLLDDNGSGVEGIGHGTEVAATVAGVAPSAKFALLDVFDGKDAWSVDIIDAISWSIGNKDVYSIVAINMSLGYSVFTSECNKTSGAGADPFVAPVRAARNAGIVVVVASGNDGYSNGLSSPACVPESLSVGSVYDANIGGIQFGELCIDSTTAADKVTCYSNSASFLDMLAPGSAITVAGQTAHGTSLAAPMVAGVVAVLKAAYPAETPAQIEARLIDNGVAVTDARNGFSKPRLNLLAAQGAPVNDGFASASAMTGANTSAAGWNFNATTQSGEPAHAGQTGGRSIWWTWAAPGIGTLALDTQGSGINTVLAVYTGTAVNALTQVAANDDGSGLSGGVSALSTTVSAGTTYRIAVDGKSGATGGISLQLVFSPAALSADLALTLSGTQGPIEAGQQANYTVAISNTGPDMAQNVVVTLNYPSGWNLANGNCTQIAAQTAACVVGNLTAGQSATLTQAFATGIQAGSYQVAATVSSDTADSLQSNDSALIGTTLTAPAASSVTEGDAPTLPEWAAILMALTLYTLSARRRFR